MKFWLSFLIFIVVGFLIGIAFGPATFLVVAVISIFGFFIYVEVNNEMQRNNSHHAQGQHQEENEKDDENTPDYWGTID